MDLPAVLFSLAWNKMTTAGKSNILQEFTWDDASHGHISIVSLLGEPATCMLSGELDAGPHNFLFSKADLSDGIYERLVRTNGRVETLPTVLVHQLSELGFIGLFGLTGFGNV